MMIVVSVTASGHRLRAGDAGYGDSRVDVGGRVGSASGHPRVASDGEGRGRSIKEGKRRDEKGR